MNVLKNGEVWKDVEGNEIHAHGGFILKHQGYCYWYGEDRRENFYVSCYRSRDLMNWEFRNHILTAIYQETVPFSRMTTVLPILFRLPEITQIFMYIG